MNQDAFRDLLSTRATAPHASARPKNLIAAGGTTTGIKQTPTISASSAAFKPWKVKGDAGPKLNSAVVERKDDKSALDEIQRMVEELRSGAPSSVLDRNKGSEDMRADDLDDSIETAFQSSKPEQVIGKKRTREDIVRELKDKRGEPSHQDISAPSPVVAKGFKRIGQKEKKEKRVKPKHGGSQVKQPRRAETGHKMDEDSLRADKDVIPGNASRPASGSEAAGTSGVVADVDADGDIFADAGEWQGYGSTSDEEAEAPAGRTTTEEAAPSRTTASRNWFNDPARAPTGSPSPPPMPAMPTTPPVVEEAESPPTRLQPLASSAIPSIRDLLSLDKEETAREIRKAKKDAWRAKQGLNPSGDGDDASDDEGRGKKKKKTKEAKLNSEYQRIKTYVER